MPDALLGVVRAMAGVEPLHFDLVAALNRILGTSIEPTFGPRRPGDVMHSLADIEKARTLLGYEPSVGFDEGLERTVAWFNKYARG